MRPVYINRIASIHAESSNEKPYFSAQEPDYKEMITNANPVSYTHLDVYKRQELDSLDLVDMVVLIDRNFGFTVTAKDFAGIKMCIRDSH